MRQQGLARGLVSQPCVFGPFVGLLEVLPDTALESRHRLSVVLKVCSQAGAQHITVAAEWSLSGGHKTGDVQAKFSFQRKNSQAVALQILHAYCGTTAFRRAPCFKPPLFRRADWPSNKPPLIIRNRST